MTGPAWFTRCSFEPDRTLRRPGPGIVVGGTPTRVLRLSDGGERVVDTLAAAGRLPTENSGALTLVERMVEAGMIHPLPPPVSHPTGVAVVIPAYDHALLVADAVRKTAHLGPVIVVDDASTDNTAEQAAAAGATVLRTAENVGPSAARNRGAAHADGDLLVFVDADCAPEAGCVETLLGHFADPKLGAVAPRILGHEGAGDNLIARYEQARSPIDMGPLPGPVRPDARVSFVPTALLVVRRSAFEEVGGFDEALRFGEDVDFVWRLVEAGWRVRYDSRVVARHHHRRRPLDIARRRWAYGASAGPLARRHPNGLAALRASPWTLAAWLAVLAGRPRLAAAVLAWSWFALNRRLRGVPRSGYLSGALVGRGFVGAGRPLASALSRHWGPITLVAAASSPLRRRLLALWSLGLAWEWAVRRPRLHPLWYAALVAVDDLVFCGGLWRGCLEGRAISPLLPRRGRPRPGGG